MGKQNMLRETNPHTILFPGSSLLRNEVDPHAFVSHLWSHPSLHPRFLGSQHHHHQPTATQSTTIFLHFVLSCAICIRGISSGNGKTGLLLLPGLGWSPSTRSACQNCVVLVLRKPLGSCLFSAFGRLWKPPSRTCFKLSLDNPSFDS